MLKYIPFWGQFHYIETRRMNLHSFYLLKRDLSIDFSDIDLLN